MREWQGRMKVRVALSRIADAIEPERVYRRQLWEQRNRYWDALAEIASHRYSFHRPAAEIAREALAADTPAMARKDGQENG